MKERGMIFNGEMVRAILDSRKTQTRRPIKWKQTRFTEIGEREDGSKWPWSEDAEHAFDFWHPCPFGSVGDRIWVRETFQGPLFDFDLMDSYCKDSTPFEKSEFCVYKADGVPAPEFYDADDELHCCCSRPARAAASRASLRAWSILCCASRSLVAFSCSSC